MKRSFYFILLFFASCNTRIETDKVITNENSYFESIQLNDLRLETPKQGEWLFEHKEPGQTFEQYKKGLIVKPSNDKFIIYLKPIGHFSKLQADVIQLTREYLEIFFQRRTILLEPVSDTIVPKSARRIRENGNEQLLAPYILDSILKGKIPKQGFVLMAISEKDLYPKPEWNFIFGLASYYERVGVSSIFRLQNKILDSSTFKICLTRVINISSHEIGHMYSLHHCIYAKCVMNGSNSLFETDLTPNRLCSECQKKLFWNIRYDNRKRLEELNNFFQRNNLKKDLALSKNDLDKLK